MNWAKKHLNWVLMIAYGLQFAAVPFDSVVPFVITQVIYLGAILWVLNRKGRALLWFLFPMV